MTWTCEQTEARLSDYLDRALSGTELEAFEAHVPGCVRCAPLVASVSHLVTGLQSMEQIEAPPRLLHAILDKTLGPRESVTGWRGLLAWVRGIATVRFAYGALSVAATFIILVTASGFNWKHPKLADLQPANLYRNADRHVHLVYAKSATFVNNLRVVNEIQSRLRQDSEIPAAPESAAPQSSPQKDPGSTDRSKPSMPRQQNRANDLARHMEVLAESLPACSAKFGALIISRRTL